MGFSESPEALYKIEKCIARKEICLGMAVFHNNGKNDWFPQVRMKEMSFPICKNRQLNASIKSKYI